mgnify:CR=1 FL=1
MNRLLLIGVAALVVILALTVWWPWSGRGAGEVVVYTSVDDVFARPIAEAFQKETGVTVRLVPDTEETKSTGLVNRLIAEKNRPQADVFWSGDPVRAEILKKQGVAKPYRSQQAEGLPPEFSDTEGYWTGFSARARVLIYNTNSIAAVDAPRSVMDLTDPRFQGRACIANPLFGTTSMHAAALFAALGEQDARRFFEDFLANDGQLASSNGDVRRLVADGRCALGVTDTDDANVARMEGKPVEIVYPDAEGMGTLIIPNAAVLIANGPNPDRGKQFIDYLLRPQTEQALAESAAAQIPLRGGVLSPEGVVTLERIHPMDVEYTTLADRLEMLSRGFLKDWVDRAR